MTEERFRLVIEGTYGSTKEPNTGRTPEDIVKDETQKFVERIQAGGMASGVGTVWEDPEEESENSSSEEKSSEENASE